jgi:hypothetical protein
VEAAKDEDRDADDGDSVAEVGSGHAQGKTAQGGMGGDVPDGSPGVTDDAAGRQSGPGRVG